MYLEQRAIATHIHSQVEATQKCSRATLSLIQMMNSSLFPTHAIKLYPHAVRHHKVRHSHFLHSLALSSKLPSAFACLQCLLRLMDVLCLLWLLRLHWCACSCCCCPKMLFGCYAYCWSFTCTTCVIAVSHVLALAAAVPRCCLGAMGLKNGRACNEGIWI